MRKHGTERAGTSLLNNEKRAGTFVCRRVRGTALFDAGTKFESGTGWPKASGTRWRARVSTTEDRSLFMTRTEVHCANCGGHLGHVFPGRAAPDKGQRYCMNGAAMKFKPT